MPQKLSPTQIDQCILFHDDAEHIEDKLLVLKYRDESNSIKIVDLVRNRETVESVILPHFQFTPLKMVCGPYNELYVVTLAENDHQHI